MTEVVELDIAIADVDRRSFHLLGTGDRIAEGGTDGVVVGVIDGTKVGDVDEALYGCSDRFTSTVPYEGEVVLIVLSYT